MRGPLLLLVFVAVVQLLCVPGRYFGSEHDDAQFVLVSRSLLRGRYTLGITPGEPPMTDGTPGWPALLAPASAVSKDLPAGYQLWSWMWMVLCDVLAWLWLRRRMGPESALAATACFALNPVVLSRAGVVMSEVPFLAALLGLLLMMESRRGLAGWAAGLWLGCSWLIRPAALPLFPAVWGWFALRRRFRDAGLSVVFSLLPVLAWKSWVEHAGKGLDDVRALGIYSAMDGAGAASTVWRTVRSALACAGGSFMPWESYGTLAVVLGAVFASAGLAGVAWHARRRGYEAAAAYVLLGMLMHVLWPYWYERYLLSFLPFLIWGVWLLLGRVIESDRARAVALALLVLIPFPKQAVGLMRGASGRSKPEFQGTYAWIRGSTEPYAMFTSLAFCRDAFYTGRPFLSLPPATAGPLAHALRSRRVKYVLWTRLPNMGSTAGEAFYWRMRQIEEELAGPEFKVAHADPGEGALVLELMK